ncbi:retron St85 family RNA-directed DNA polymerase [Shewanella sp. A14]
MTKLKSQILKLPTVVENFLPPSAPKKLNEVEGWALYYANSQASNALDVVLVQGPKMYKVYSIPKRSGGLRVIAHPSKKLKIFQYGLISVLEHQLPIHDSAFAYRKNRSIKDNALVHVKNQYLLKMDFLNFFNSIDDQLLFERLLHHKIEIDDLTLIKSLLFWSPLKTIEGKHILSVGAPTSPMISNFILYEFDDVITTICSSLNVSFSRYADDLFFSTDEEDVLKNIPTIVRYFVHQIYGEKIRLNESKTTFTSKAHNRHVTGIVLNNNNQLSLGRKRKRAVKTMVFRAINGHADQDELLMLQGMLAFCKSIEPSFIETLYQKYTKNNVVHLMTANWRA